MWKKLVNCGLMSAVQVGNLNEMYVPALPSQTCPVPNCSLKQPSVPSVWSTQVSSQPDLHQTTHCPSAQHLWRHACSSSCFSVSLGSPLLPLLICTSFKFQLVQKAAFLKVAPQNLMGQNYLGSNIEILECTQGMKTRNLFSECPN